MRNEGPGADTHFVDSTTIAATNVAGGVDWTGGSKVPAENVGIGADHLRRRTVFGNEIMVDPPWSPNPPLSAVTVQAMAVLGYEVDVRMADPYELPGADAMADGDRGLIGNGRPRRHGESVELIHERGRVVGI